MPGPSPVINPEPSYSPASSSETGVPRPQTSAGGGLGTPSGEAPAPIPPKSGITELFGTILIVVGILVFLALLSFQMDLSEGGTPSPGTNLIGTVGHYSAQMLFYLFGKSAFLAGPWLFLLGGLTIYRGGFSDPVSRLLALLTVMLGSSLLGGILWGSDGTPSEGAGGLIGLYLGGSLQTLFGFYGALILALGVFAAGVFLSIRLPMPVVWAAIGNALGRKIDGLNRIFTENRYRPEKQNPSPPAGPEPGSFSENAFAPEESNSAAPNSAWDTSENKMSNIYDKKNKNYNKNTDLHGAFFRNKESMIQKVEKNPKEPPPWFQKITIGEGDPNQNQEEMPAEEEGFRGRPFGHDAASEPFKPKSQKDGKEALANGGMSHEGFFGEGGFVNVSETKEKSSFEGFRSSYEPEPDALGEEGGAEPEDEFFYEGYFADSEDRFFFRGKKRGFPRSFGESPTPFESHIGVPRAPQENPPYFRGASEIRRESDKARAHFQGKQGIATEPIDEKSPLLRPLPKDPIREDGPALGNLPDSREVLYRYRRRLDGREPALEVPDSFADGNSVSQEEAMERRFDPVPSSELSENPLDLPQKEPFTAASPSKKENMLQHKEALPTEALESTRKEEQEEKERNISKKNASFEQNALHETLEKEAVPQEVSAQEIPAKESSNDKENRDSKTIPVGAQGLPKPPVSVRDILHEAVGTQEDLPPVSVRDGADRSVAEPRRRKPERSLVPELSLEKENYFIPTDILRPARRLSSQQIEEDIELTKLRLEQVFADYRIPARVVRTQRGPIITLYEIKLDPGTKVARISGIHDEIKMHLEAQSIRIIAPIPGRPTVGIEIPNRKRQPISLREMLSERPPKGEGLSIVLGANIKGKKMFGDLTKLPHLLIAGATGSGKSVYMNSVIASLLCSYSPEKLRFIMIDPKMVELRLFEGIPHLLMPVITDVRKANKALTWAVMEMERRYAILSALKSRDIRSYNERMERRGGAGTGNANKMPYIVVLIDELADLMMVAAKDVEDSIIRLTQKARAVGIHLVMATQRPSVDVITALIKANCPARIAFQVSQKTDSRTILDANGAEALLGKGDMLYRSPVSTSLERLQAPFISEQEIEELVSESRRFGEPVYVDLGEDDSEFASDEADGEAESDLLDEAWRIIKESGKTSTSYVQRRLRIGYNRAANLIEELEDRGYLGPAIGNKPREILKRD